MIVAYEAIEFNNHTILVVAGVLDIEIDSELDFCTYPLYNMMMQK